MTNHPILYSFRRCPYAIRARMAIAVSVTKVELREVVLRDKPHELHAVSSKATVPVLVLPGPVVIDESLDVMRWALGKNDPENWLLDDHKDLIAVNDGPFKTALDRYKYTHRYDLKHGLAQREAGLGILFQLNVRLGARPFLAGETRALADVAIFPFVRQFAAADQPWFDAQPLPYVHRWLNRLVSSALFEVVMRRYPQWRTGDEITLFP